jgi:phosphoserine phosphatase RsbU/P
MPAMKASEAEADAARAADEPELRFLAKAGTLRMYSSSALHAARHFYYAREDAGILGLAEDFQDLPGLPVAAIVDRDGAARRVLRRDRLFGLLGKPFGREVLGRSLASELAEELPIFDAHADLFAVAERMLGGEDEYCLLVGEGGRFHGVLAVQDLANYLSRMTQEDIELAGRLQERLMASSALPGGIAGCAVDAWSRPAKGVGGDFFYTRRLPDGKLFLTLCDVSGKGVAASLIVAMAYGMLESFDYGLGLRALVRALNDAVVRSFHMEKYLTGVFLIFDPRTRRLLCADMGHSHAILFRRGRPRSLKGPRGNLPIGVELELDPAVFPYRLEASDELLVYSDGLVEQEDPSGAEFGERRLVSTAAAAIARGEQLRRSLPAALDAFRRGVPQQDDMSFLSLLVAEDEA